MNWGKEIKLFVNRWYNCLCEKLQKITTENILELVSKYKQDCSIQGVCVKVNCFFICQQWMIGI